MKSQGCVARPVRIKWLVALVVFFTALIVLLSSIYFLYLPTGGYQGGRNPTYGIVILFSRETWEFLHTWVGVAFIAAILVHMPIHWSWIVGTIRRMRNNLIDKDQKMNSKVKLNILVDGIIGFSFLVAAITGLRFLLLPNHGTASQLLNITTLDIIHTWSGVVMSLAAIAHFFIHWSWISKITPKIVKLPERRPAEITINETPSGNPVILSNK